MPFKLRMTRLYFFHFFKEQTAPGFTKKPEPSKHPIRLVLIFLFITSSLHHFTSLLLIPRNLGGGERDRTDDPLLAKQVLSQLSYTPVFPGGSGWS